MSYLAAQPRPISPETRAAAAADPRPWLEVRPSDYVCEDYIATQAAAHAILQRCFDGGLRLRLILSQAVDLKSPGRDPLLPQNYRGPATVFVEAAETVIELKNGRRLLCTGQYGWERGYV